MLKVIMDKISEALTRGVEDIFPDRQSLEKVLRSGRKIRLYQGFDPTMPNLHLGHMVGLLKLKQFQELGHEVIFLIGDFTGMIGDPTDKLATRKQLTDEEVKNNSRQWKKQAGRFLEFGGKNPAFIKRNSAWLKKLTFAEVIRLACLLTYQQMIKREMFRKRIKENRDIYLHEFLYPLMQGYDSVYMDVDLEIGGNDQMFNMLVGRDLMRKLKNKEKFVLTTKLLIDEARNKVGKTTGNALFLNSSPEEMFGGIMSFPDDVIGLAFELLTTVPYQEVLSIQKNIKLRRVNPMDLKKRLAFEIVSLNFGEKSAERAQGHFESLFQKSSSEGATLPVYTLRDKQADIIDLMVAAHLAPSRSEAKRLIRQRAVDLNGKTLDSRQTIINIASGDVIRAGKHKFVKIKLEGAS